MDGPVTQAGSARPFPEIDGRILQERSILFLVTSHLGCWESVTAGNPLGCTGKSSFQEKQNKKPIHRQHLNDIIASAPGSRCA
jgi:hypothetical protein